MTSNRVKKNGGAREAAGGCSSKLASLFANYLNKSRNQLPPPCSRVFSENYLHSFNGSLSSRKPLPILSPAPSSFLDFDVLSEVSSDSWRKRAEGECRGKSTGGVPERKKGEKREESGKTRSNREKDKAEGAKRSERVFRDGCSSKLAAKERRVLV